MTGPWQEVMSRINIEASVKSVSWDRVQSLGGA